MQAGAGAAEAEAAIAALNAQELASLEQGAEGASPDAGGSSPESADEEEVRCGRGHLHLHKANVADHSLCILLASSRWGSHAHVFVSIHTNTCAYQFVGDTSVQISIVLHAVTAQRTNHLC